MRLKPIEEQVVVVMGASSGIGKAAALRFAERGAKVVVSARGAEALQAVVEEIRAKGGEALCVPADVADWKQVQVVAERAAAEYGRIDTWVHAAGVGLWARFDQTRPEEWKRVLDVNLNGQAYGAMAALPYLKREGRGALIHLASVEAKLAVPYQAAYGASKHGIDALTRVLRMELEHDGLPISVTSVMPYGIDTPIFSKALTRIGTKPRPLYPLYDPSIAADAILFAAENPIPELVIGGVGKMSTWGRFLPAPLYNLVFKPVAFRGQHTQDPKSEHAPNNLFHPMQEDQRIRGDFTGESRKTSLYTWLETHPEACRAAWAVSALGAVALWAAWNRRREA